MPRLVVPWMKLDGRDLRRGNQAFDAVDLDVGFTIAFDFRDGEQVRHAAHLMALEEPLAIDAVRRADDGAGTALEMLDHPRADLLQILREVELGVVVRCRP